MAPFQYEQYRNPFVGSISDLITRPGDIRAAAAERIAAAQANAAQQIGAAQSGAAQASGQAYAGAAQGVGNAIAGSIQQATDPRRQLEAEQVKQLKEGEMFTKQINGLISKNGLITPEGTVDRAKLGAAMAQSNIPMNLQEQTFKTLDNVEGSIQKFKQIKVDHLADIAHAALQDPHGQTPEGFMVLAGLAKANGLASDADLAPIGAALASGADPKALLGSIRSLSEKYKDVNKPVVVPRGGTLSSPTGDVIAKGQPEIPTPASLAAAMNDPSKSDAERNAAKTALAAVQAPAMAGHDETARHNAEMERIAGLQEGRQEAANKETARHNSAMEAQGDAAPTLTPEARKMAAQQYAMTGQLPPMGMGKSGAAVRTSIINEAASIYKDLDLPSQVAAYKANQESLKKIQVQADAMKAFENTAGKNMDVFLGLASKVTDTGSPMLNKPIRSIQASTLGDTDQAAFNVALRTVIPEYAKILANPGLSGQLSDSARKEIDNVVSGNATMGQLISSAKILKQDTANRRESYDQQIADIQKRIATPPGAPKQSEAAAAAPMTRTIRNTKTGETKTQTSTDGGVTWK